MKIATLSNTDLVLTISGPLEPYDFEYEAEFTDNVTVSVDVTMKSQMSGNNEDKFLITFETNKFENLKGATLSTATLDGALNKGKY